eukprot:4119830-Amphidinium_carterae.1
MAVSTQGAGVWCTPLKQIKIHASACHDWQHEQTLRRTRAALQDRSWCPRTRVMTAKLISRHLSHMHASTKEPAILWTTRHAQGSNHS